MANDIGLKYKFEELDLAELLDGVSRGDLDAGIGPLTINAEREKMFYFTHSFFNTGLGVVVKKESDTSINDLVRVRLATVKSSTSEGFLNRERINFRSAANITDAFILLADNKADAIVYDKPLLRYLVKKSYANEFEVLSFTFEPKYHGFTIKEGKQELVDINRSILARTQASYWADLIYRHLGN